MLGFKKHPVLAARSCSSPQFLRDKEKTRIRNPGTQNERARPRSDPERAALQAAVPSSRVRTSGGFREARGAGVGPQVAGPERARGAGAKNKREPHSRPARPRLANRRGPSSRGPLIGCSATNHAPRPRAPAAPRGAKLLAREGRGRELGRARSASGT